MADTVVHETAHAHEDSGAATGIILAVILLLIFAFIVAFGIPFVRGTTGVGQPQVNVPVPDKVDVNVQGGAK